MSGDKNTSLWPASTRATFEGARGLPSIVHGLGPIQDATDLPDLFATLARSVVDATRADACLVSLWEPTRDVLRDVAASVVSPARLNAVAEEYALSEFPATRSVLETGAPIEVTLTDPTADPAERQFLADSGFTRVLISRLHLDPETIGTLETYRLVDHPFTAQDVDHVHLLETFAGNVLSRMQLAARLESHYTETIEALASALEARDPYTQAHAGRIRDTAVALAVALHVPRDELRAVRLGSLLHDVGKIGIADSILSKPAPLSDSEVAIMRSHPLVGERMLAGVEFLATALPIVRHHHERWDGAGYPDGLAGDEIPLGARIVSVCDAFDAITSDRPYRGAMSSEVACAEILREAGRQFDPACASLLVDVVRYMGEQERLEERFVRYS
jgi:response regulator RpfG family c-di-GMP phosphodiesterase